MNKGLLAEVAPMVTMNLDLSSHQKYLMKVQRDADHKYYTTQLAKIGEVVEGAGLTDGEIVAIRKDIELPRILDMPPVVLFADRAGQKVAQAQLQAILKALDK